MVQKHLTNFLARRRRILVSLFAWRVGSRARGVQVEIDGCRDRDTGLCLRGAYRRKIGDDAIVIVIRASSTVQRIAGVVEREGGAKFEEGGWAGSAKQVELCRRRCRSAPRRGGIVSVGRGRSKGNATGVVVGVLVRLRLYCTWPEEILAGGAEGSAVRCL